ncbi:MAG: hypothetical protein JRF56_00140 [Deltaproteobacteria bacterium]|nr:hypothetical protein [Deltaproteobacteria bacterium]
MASLFRIQFTAALLHQCGDFGVFVAGVVGHILVITVDKEAGLLVGVEGYDEVGSQRQDEPNSCNRHAGVKNPRMTSKPHPPAPACTYLAVLHVQKSILGSKATVTVSTMKLTITMSQAKTIVTAITTFYNSLIKINCLTYDW